MNTFQKYSPWDLLPLPEPRLEWPTDDFFYENVSKHLVKDIVRITQNGIPIDLDKVADLEEVLDDVLADVQAKLAANPLIAEFQRIQHSRIVNDYIAEQKSKIKEPAHFLKPFDYKKMEHRSYFMHCYEQDHPLPIKPSEYLLGDVLKWTVRDVKRYDRPVLLRLVNGDLTESNKYVKAAMQLLAEHKAELYNRRFGYHENIANAPDLPIPPFNPASAPQKQALFDWLGIESEKTSKDTGLPSWDRDEIERVNKETTNEHVKDFTQSFIDYSFGAIVKNNFIKAFYDYTIDGRLYGSMKLFGAKSFRLTSQNPNLLNVPSTKSVYSKPVKKCFTAPPGYVILAIDYGALEDRVIASLTRDTNKCNIFLEGLDGHSLNAYGYFKEEVAKHMDLTGDTTIDVKKMYELVESGHSELKAIRQKGKPATFGLSYGAFPLKVSRTLKISLPAAEAIFNSYHNELYSGITDYRENYVLPTAAQHGRIHIGMGCYLKTDNADRDIRTLNNATCQFWSILTLLTINKMHQLIDEAGFQDKVQCISTIYDSIYYCVEDNPQTIKWVNDNLVPIMCQDFMVDQTIKNEATAEIGLDWASMEQISNGASIAEIRSVLTKLKDN